MWKGRCEMMSLNDIIDQLESRVNNIDDITDDGE